LLVPIIAVLIGGQLVLMGYFLLRKKPVPAPPPAVTGTKQPADPLAHYILAQKYAAERRYLQALDALAEARRLGADQRMVRMTGDLERRVRFELQFEEAQRLIREQKWKAASHVLDAILEQDPGEQEAKRLAERVRKELGAEPKTPDEDGEAVASAEPEQPKKAAGTPDEDGEAAEPKQKRKKAAGTPDEDGEAAEPKQKRKKAAAAKPRGFLSVASTPTARVSIDDVLYGFTPRYGISLPPGKHIVTVFRDGFRTYTGRVNIVSSDKKALDVRLAAEEPAKVETKKVETKPVVKVETKKVEPAKVAPKPIGAIPTLPLPAKLTVTNTPAAVGRVCASVEQAVQRAIDRPTAGLTADLQKAADRITDADVTLHPRTIGYLMADALKNDWRPAEIRQMLATGLTSGRIASLAKVNWRPR
jgi:hypothetical protein